MWLWSQPWQCMYVCMYVVETRWSNNPIPKETRATRSAEREGKVESWADGRWAGMLGGFLRNGGPREIGRVGLFLLRSVDKSANVFSVEQFHFISFHFVSSRFISFHFLCSLPFLSFSSTYSSFLSSLLFCPLPPLSFPFLLFLSLFPFSEQVVLHFAGQLLKINT